MASQRGKGRDLWAEIRSQEEEEQAEEEQEDQTRIGIVYRRRRTPEDPANNVPTSQSRRESRVSLAPGKRPSWNRSLSTRGRESIVVTTRLDFRPPTKPTEAKKPPKAGLSRLQKGFGKWVPPDFGKERAYFEEVDEFKLVEESPSPKQFGTWAMGLQNNYVMCDLPAILERWRISKLACGSSGPLSRIMETPGVPAESSCNEDVNASIEKTPERILRSFDALHIGDFGEGDSTEELEVVKKCSLPSNSTSLSAKCRSAFAQLLMVCKQSVPLTLTDMLSKYSDPGGVVKIGEGTYGEAFKSGATVCKIVPIDGDLLVNGEVQKKSEEVLEEVLLSLTLNSLRGQEGEKCNQNVCSNFIETKNFWVCQGAYGAALIRAWEDWDGLHGSENDHPKEFPDKQCYVVFVLADGGRDLENFVLLNFDEAQSLLVQVTAALAVAEVACEFEHRDLHWGNILLTRKEATMMEFTIQGRKMWARTYGLAVSVIDFTLSRINTGEAIFFLDLSADPGLFEGPKGDRQAETYRKMKEVTEECWDGSFPKTNVLWLQYLVDILLLKKSFKRTAKDERDLRSFKKRLNSYDSAKDSLSDTFFKNLLVDHTMPSNIQREDV